MPRQFDVIFLGRSKGKKFAPPFEDNALGWFFEEEWDKSLNAEWVIFASQSINITRDFLNNLADTIASYPMIDALAPKIRSADSQFHRPLIYSKYKGFVEIKDTSQNRFVAAPHPCLGVFSSRIIQRTGLLDNKLPLELKLADYTLRMMHAGGRMFYVPYLVVESKEQIPSAHKLLKSGMSKKSTMQTIYKNSGPLGALCYGIFHPLTFFSLFANLHNLKKKHKAATSLSKWTDQLKKEVSKE
ncbi:MAG: hypothetical protein HUK21_09905 [Fibrobacteraceae bacterium]|nr:hypothetical protein [Fibrobacteraceae bacterium]